MYIRCILGFHDLELITRIDREQLRLNMEAERDGQHLPSILGTGRYYIDGICLRCGDKIDTITPAKEAIKEEWKEITRRRTKLKELMKE